MRNLAALLLALAGCWTNASDPPPLAPAPEVATAPAPQPRRARPRSSPFAEAMAKMAEFRDEMCGCHDTACAQQVADEMTKWSQDQAKDMVAMPKMSEEDTKAATQIGEEMGRCMQQAMGFGSGSTP